MDILLNLLYNKILLLDYVYSSQDSPESGIVLEPVTLWARGERNIQGIFPLLVLTNCDEIEFCLNNNKDLVRIKPDRQNFPHLPYPPVIAEAKHFSEKIFGTWGTDWQDVTIKGYVEGITAKIRRFVADPVPTKLEVIPDALEITLGADVRVMIRVLDQVGNKMRHFLDPATVDISGPAKLFGPRNLTLRAGSVGFWLRATEIGRIKLSVGHERFNTKTVDIMVK